jgi:hypothetical protein
MLSPHNNPTHILPLVRALPAEVTTLNDFRIWESFLTACFPSFLSELPLVMSHMHQDLTAELSATEALASFHRSQEYLCSFIRTYMTDHEQVISAEIQRILSCTSCPSPDFAVITPKSLHEPIQFELQAWFRDGVCIACISEVTYKDNLVASMPTCASNILSRALGALGIHPLKPLDEIRAYNSTVFFTQNTGLQNSVTDIWLELLLPNIEAGAGLQTSTLMPIQVFNYFQTQLVSSA